MQQQIHTISLKRRKVCIYLTFFFERECVFRKLLSGRFDFDYTLVIQLKVQEFA